MTTLTLKKDDKMIVDGDGKVWVMSPVMIEYEEESTPVPDNISADHIDGLCNMLLGAMEYAAKYDPSPYSTSKYERYFSAIQHARDRAKALRKGTI